MDKISSLIYWVKAKRFYIEGQLFLVIDPSTSHLHFSNTIFTAKIIERGVLVLHFLNKNYSNSYIRPSQDNYTGPCRNNAYTKALIRLTPLAIAALATATGTLSRKRGSIGLGIM